MGSTFWPAIQVADPKQQYNFHHSLPPTPNLSTKESPSIGSFPTTSLSAKATARYANARRRVCLLLARGERCTAAFNPRRKQRFVYPAERHAGFSVSGHLPSVDRHPHRTLSSPSTLCHRKMTTLLNPSEFWHCS